MVIGRELSHSSSGNLCLRFWVYLASNFIRNEAPHFVDLGILAVNVSDEFNLFGTPATRIISPTEWSYGSDPDHVFGKPAAVGMSTTRLEQDYSQKTDFDIWRENKDFGRQNISMSRPPLDSTPISMNIINRTTSPIDSITIQNKSYNPRH